MAFRLKANCNDYQTPIASTHILLLCIFFKFELLCLFLFDFWLFLYFKQTTHNYQPSHVKPVAFLMKVSESIILVL